MINTYKPKLTILQQDILKVLFMKSGISLNARRISKILNVSHPAVSKALPLLEKLNLIKIRRDKESKRLSIELNRDNEKAMQLKRVSNLKLIYESGLANFLEEKFPGATTVLFGSYSRGDDSTNSDIDIAIIGAKEKKLNLEKFEKILERKVNLNFYESLKKINKNLKENICNGIVLIGGIEL